MALPTNPARSWMQGFDLPTDLLGEGILGGTGHEMYEEDGEFALTVDMPGFSADDIDVAWDDGVLNVAAERTAEDRGRRRTYHRRFRFPKEVDPDAVTAEYRNGVLEVRLPIDEAAISGRRIPVEG